MIGMVAGLAFLVVLDVILYFATVRPLLQRTNRRRWAKVDPLVRRYVAGEIDIETFERLRGRELGIMKDMSPLERDVRDGRLHLSPGAMNYRQMIEAQLVYPSTKDPFGVYPGAKWPIDD